LEDKIILNRLEVVQDQQKPALQLQDLIAEGRYYDLGWRQLTGKRYIFNLPAQIRVQILERCQEIGKKSPGIIVGGIQG
jgi:hypothetical protein